MEFLQNTAKPETMSKWTLRRSLAYAVGTTFTIVLGTAVRGDIFLMYIYLRKVYEAEFTSQNTVTGGLSVENATAVTRSLEQSEAIYYVLGSVIFSFVFYFCIGGYFHYNYYVRRKQEPKEWKCQPERWLSAANERHEIMLGSFNLISGGSLGGLMAYYIANDGWSRLYFRFSDYGLWYFLFSTVIMFLYQDGLVYYIHRVFHTPFLYRWFHKWHHRYHSPTAFSATAIHPVEFIIIQLAMVTPMVLIPVHAGAFVTIMLYGYYYGMVDHSGIKFESMWPWQQDSMFHDDHHKYFHTNFGFNTKIFDWIHGTIRIPNRRYTEDIFGGKGEEVKKIK